MMTSPLSSKLMSPQAAKSGAPVLAWVVEDDPRWQEAFQLMLGMAFDHVCIHRATCEAETRTWLDDQTLISDIVWPDVVLMDWQLAQNGDGLQLLEKWVARGLPEERIIVVSGASDVPPHHFHSVSKSEAAKKLLPTLLSMQAA